MKKTLATSYMARLGVAGAIASATLFALPATAQDNRLFVDAVLWIAKTGAPWRDLPERFGKWNSVWRRFDRWARKGVWRKVFEALQDPDLEWMILDSTVVRAHQHAAGAGKKRE